MFRAINCKPFNILAAFGALGAATFASAETQAGPMSIWQPEQVGPKVTHITFWSHPYPYGYAYVGHRDSCLERHRVKTASGWHWRTVSVCSDRLVTKY